MCLHEKICEKFAFHNHRSVNSKDVWFDSYEEEYFRSRQKYNNMVAMMVGMDAEISSSHAVADYVILCYRVMMLFYLRTLKKKKP